MLNINGNLIGNVEIKTIQGKDGEVTVANFTLFRKMGKEGEKKKQGLNEVINLAMQKDEGIRNKLRYRAHKFTPLFKQILNDRSTLSFIPETFENDRKVLESIEAYKLYLSEQNILEKAQELLCSMNRYDSRKLSIDGKYISKLSQAIFNSWSKIHDGIKDYKKSLLPKETKKAFDPKKRIGWHIFRRAMDMGLVLRPMGDIIYFNPPLNIEKTDLDKAVELCRKAVVTVLGE